MFEPICKSYSSKAQEKGSKAQEKGSEAQEKGSAQVHVTPPPPPPQGVLAITSAYRYAEAMVKILLRSGCWTGPEVAYLQQKLQARGFDAGDMKLIRQEASRFFSPQLGEKQWTRRKWVGEKFSTPGTQGIGLSLSRRTRQLVRRSFCARQVAHARSGHCPEALLSLRCPLDLLLGIQRAPLDTVAGQPSLKLPGPVNWLASGK